MRSAIVAGNWKMNGTATSVCNLLAQIIANYQTSKSIELAIFPPFVYLEMAQKILDKTSIVWGGQNFYYQSNGAFTGEISTEMLKDLNCKYVIVGHSERRTYFAEDDLLIGKKWQKALEANLIPILCVGETQQQRYLQQTFAVIKTQLTSLLTSTKSVDELAKIVIAYEPVWAIGTGQSATPDQAQEVHAAIREMLSQKNKVLAEKVKIIYGGSVNANNAKQLMHMPDIDGALVGSASLDAKQFLEIAKSCKQ